MDVTGLWLPYCGPAPGPGAWLGQWNLDPVLCGALALWGAALWRPARGRHVTDGRQRTALRWAWALLALLYVSPLCALGSAFFTARVLHDMLLVFVVAPLLARGLEPQLARLRWAHCGTVPLWTWTALAAASFWAWHAPGPYAAALSSVPVFWLMQGMLLGSALGFWHALRQAQPAAAIAGVLASMVQMGLLGALITFAERPLFAPHFISTLPWGISALDDQQLAGIVMWAPGSFGYLAAALAIGWAWLHGGREPGLELGHEGEREGGLPAAAA